ncbi:hypothetical protein ACFE04_008346 [Oxalis oulophora]
MSRWIPLFKLNQEQMWLKRNFLRSYLGEIPKFTSRVFAEVNDMIMIQIGSGLATTLILPSTLASLDDLTPEQKEMLGNLHKSCVGETGVSEDTLSRGTLRVMKYTLDSCWQMEEDGTFDFEAYVDLLPESMAATVKNSRKNAVT